MQHVIWAHSPIVILFECMLIVVINLYVYQLVKRLNKDKTKHTSGCEPKWWDTSFGPFSWVLGGGGADRTWRVVAIRCGAIGWMVVVLVPVVHVVGL